jgi:5-methylcytosine-specific restriction endonuclease McrA
MNVKLPRGWQCLRQRVLWRDGYICWLCGGAGADSADHVVARAKGGSHEESNLRAAHRWCNSSKGTRVVLPRARISERWG